MNEDFHGVDIAGNVLWDTIRVSARRFGVSAHFLQYTSITSYSRSYVPVVFIRRFVNLY